MLWMFGAAGWSGSVRQPCALSDRGDRSLCFFQEAPDDVNLLEEARRCLEDCEPCGSRVGPASCTEGSFAQLDDAWVDARKGVLGFWQGDQRHHLQRDIIPEPRRYTRLPGFGWRLALVLPKEYDLMIQEVPPQNWPSSDFALRHPRWLLRPICGCPQNPVKDTD